MIHFDSLVLSVPAPLLGEGPVPASVFPLEELRKLGLPPDLRLAVDLIAAQCPGVTLQCVARPEMFTHGASREWLETKIDGATDHVNLSDGTAIKLIPGLRNHVFMYGLQTRHHLDAFRRLLRWAPELLGSVDTQINSFHRAFPKSRMVQPNPMPLMPLQAAPAGTTWFYAFYMNPHSAEDSANRMLSWGDFAATQLGGFERLTYVPLTDGAATDTAYIRLLTSLVAGVYFEPTHGLLIRLPPPGPDLAARLTGCLEAIRATAVSLPRSRSTNIFFLSGDLPEQSLRPMAARISFLLHQSVDFWRYTRRTYAEAAGVTVFLEQEWGVPPDAATTMFAQAFGQAPRILVGARTPRGAGMSA